MAKQSIRSSVSTIINMVQKGCIEDEYDKLSVLFKKNSVSCYSLNLLINSVIQYKNYIEDHINSNSLIYYVSSPKITDIIEVNDLRSENKWFKSQLRSIKRKLNLYRILTIIFFMMFLFVLSFLVSLLI